MQNVDETHRVVPLENRQPWYVPAVIFGGLEFCIPVLLVGGVLVQSFGIGHVFLILLLALVGIQWAGNAVAGYIGAQTGLTSTDLAGLSFGQNQARIFVGAVILIITLGWWAIQTTVATDALAVLIGVDKGESSFVYAILMIVVGALFALPSVFGYSSMKWVDMIAMPAGLLLVFGALYLSFQNIGWDQIVSWSPSGGMGVLAAINLIISINVAQWLIATDYTRHAQPTWRANILIPLGIIAVGLPLFMVGAVMSVGSGTADIVEVMKQLGFPAWGFVFLWIATWTSQLVSNYTGGLVLTSLFKAEGDNSRKIFTVAFAAVGVVLALLGIIDYFVSFLYFTAIIIPPIAGVIFAHFFFVSRSNDEPTEGWNWRAALATAIGVGIGYLTQYVWSLGIPAVQSLVISSIVYIAFNGKLESARMAIT